MVFFVWYHVSKDDEQQQFGPSIGCLCLCLRGVGMIHLRVVFHQFNPRNTSFFLFFLEDICSFQSENVFFCLNFTLERILRDVISTTHSANG